MQQKQTDGYKWHNWYKVTDDHEVDNYRNPRPQEGDAQCPTTGDDEKCRRNTENDEKLKKHRISD